MKYVRTAGFLIDLRRLPAEHRKLLLRGRQQAFQLILDLRADLEREPAPVVVEGRGRLEDSLACSQRGDACDRPDVLPGGR